MHSKPAAGVAARPGGRRGELSVVLPTPRSPERSVPPRPPPGGGRWNPAVPEESSPVRSGLCLACNFFKDKKKRKQKKRKKKKKAV